MAISPTSPITGAAMSGLTTPTYTFVADAAPDSNAKQFAITALGGTQTGVSSHSIGNPFTHAYFRPKQFRLLGTPNPVTGRIKEVPMNRSQLLTRKGLLPLAGQPVVSGFVRTYIEIPAGSDTADANSVKAMLSAHIGLLTQIASGIGDTVITGVM